MPRPSTSSQQKLEAHAIPLVIKFISSYRFSLRARRSAEAVGPESWTIWTLDASPQQNPRQPSNAGLCGQICLSWFAMLGPRGFLMDMAAPSSCVAGSLGRGCLRVQSQQTGAAGVQTVQSYSTRSVFDYDSANTGAEYGLRKRRGGRQSSLPRSRGLGQRIGQPSRDEVGRSWNCHRHLCKNSPSRGLNCQSCMLCSAMQCRDKQS